MIKCNQCNKLFSNNRQLVGHLKVHSPKYQKFEITLEDMKKGNVEGLERSDIEHKTSAATQQVRNLDISQTPSFYKGHLGDSVISNKKKMLVG